MLQPDAQNCGYGTMLLKYAMKQCKGTTSLWGLSSNVDADWLYGRNGFNETGNHKKRNGQLYEIELVNLKL